MGEVKSKPSPKQVFDACVGGILEGLTQKQIIKQLDISKDTLKKKLGKKHTSWKELLGKTQVDQEVKVMPKVDLSPKKHDPHLSPFSSAPTPQPGGGTASPGLVFDPKQTMYRLANEGNFQATRYILENRHYFAYEADVPPYIRPKCFHEMQNEIVDAILDPTIKFIFVEGVQRGGKNTCIFAGLHELILSNPKKQWQFDIMVGKGKHAQRLLRNMYNDNILEDQNHALITTVTNNYLMWFNGSRLDAHDTTVADIKGADTDVGWIDEFDVALKKDPAACLSLMFTMRANTHLKGIFSANVDRGLFILLQDHFTKEALEREDVKFFSIMNENAPHAEAAGNDDILKGLSDILVGKSFTKMRLDNEFDGTGNQFDTQDINDAYAIYETFCMQEGLNPKNMATRPDYTILAIDPSNVGHPFGWFLGGLVHNYVFEIKSGMFQMGLDDVGIKWTPERINLFMLKLCKDYHVNVVVIENNTYGAALAIFLMQNGINVEFQGFGGEGKSNDRENFISVVRSVFSNHCVALVNWELKPQLVIYDPIERTAEDYKGDIADAFIHFVWKAVGGLDYIPDKLMKPTLNRGAVR